MVTTFDRNAAPTQVIGDLSGGLLNRQDDESFTFVPGSSKYANVPITNAAKIASDDPNFIAYRKSFDSGDVFLDLYKPGAANTELALTYTSFGRWRGGERAGVVTEANRLYFVYGLETIPGLLAAKTGKASYTGIAYGAAANAQTGARYDVKGTSRFDVDFGTQSLTAELALRGTSTVGGSDVDFGSFAFASKIDSYNGESIAEMTKENTFGRLSTRFYGPDGDEIAGPFTLLLNAGSPDGRTAIAGVALAKRR
ncbi:transferrin-binding protein-like solute binding protein [Sphingomonas sp. Leaf25]|uniref:transferrin-binding protein-like solute binding protein n=1 Tax=Sphingomonas sp. Leaf25 TaxID=1735692 RepID=UPI0039DF6C91